MIFPDRKNESYRYTSFAKFSGLKLVPAPAAKEVILPQALSAFDEKDAPRLVFINGLLAKTLSTDLKILNLVVDAFTDADGALDDPFVKFNAVQSPQGLAITAPKNAVIEKPLKVFFFDTAEKAVPETKFLFSPRLRVRVESGAKLHVEEYHLAGKSGDTFENSAVEIQVDDGGNMTHHGVFLGAPNATSVNSVVATLGRNASLTTHSFSLGAGLERHNLSVTLSGEGASCRLFGLYAIGPNLHIDHHTRVEHAHPSTTSEQVYKGIIAENGKATFSGKVLIAKGAHKSAAAQINRNLLLGPKAEANAKPELEILNDDVKCSHGATVGQLSDEELFYLESRGIPREQAFSMLVRGFAEDVIARIESAKLRENLSRILNGNFFNKGN